MHTVYYPPVPGAIPLRETLRYGCEIDIYGRVNHGGHKNFSIELLSGPHIVLHVNFRFHHDHDVVMNTYCGSWGNEIRHRNPLKHDQEFHLHIHAHEEYYEIELNGTPLAHFPHRFPMECVQALGMKGEVVIERVEFSGFHFHIDWNCDGHDYGHAGYTHYGSERYEPPTFHETHPYNAYF
ncbi:Galectin [Trichostrongylus colubriformis]|uniref:Galectin n=1 Tax=Trichostrongylus colubriformis TaxID=6319 RepID=A0AAN8ID10_TRICO